MKRLVIIFVVVFISFLAIEYLLRQLKDWDHALSTMKASRQDTVVYVVNAQSQIKLRDSLSAIFGDYLELEVNNLSKLLEYPDTCCREINDSLIVLSFNGVAHSSIKASNINQLENKVVFFLDQRNESLKKLVKNENIFSNRIKVTELTVCIDGKIPVPTGVKNFTFYSKRWWIIIEFFLLIVLITSIYSILISSKKELISEKANGVFSLAQSQITFWTILISFSVVYIWIKNEAIPEMTSSLLALMGISTGTLAGSKSVEFIRRKPGSNSNKISKGFFSDMVSDSSSLKIQRFQMVFWTIFLGFVFIYQVIVYQQLPDISDNYLILIGISSGSYVLLKATEL